MTRTAHVDRLLTDLAVGYVRQNPSAARLALGDPYRVKRTSDRYFVWSRDDFLRDDMALTGPGVEAPLWVPRGSTGTYQIDPYKLATLIVWEERDNADDPAGFERGKIAGLMSKARYREDALFAGRAMLNTSWAASNRLVGVSASPSTGEFLSFIQSGSDPIGIIERGRDTVRTQTGGRAANVLVVSADVDRTLRVHSQIQSKINSAISASGQLTGAARREQMAGILGVDRYVVIDVSRATNIEGAATAVSDLSTGQMCLMYVDPSATSDGASAQAMRFFELSGEAYPGVGSVRRWTDDAKAADVIEVQTAVDFRVVGDVAGVHFASCLA